MRYKYVLSLTGTPVQNRLSDLQSLIKLMKIDPWCQDWLWERFLIPRMQIGSSEAIHTLNRLMGSVCLRRTKDVILNLPQKIEKVIMVTLAEPWKALMLEQHQFFVQCFGRLRDGGQAWDSAEFLRQMMILRQFCNHPIFARETISYQGQYCWQDSAKIVHLINHLTHLLKDRRYQEPCKVVVFSGFVAFLEM